MNKKRILGVEMSPSLEFISLNSSAQEDNIPAPNMHVANKYFNFLLIQFYIVKALCIRIRH